MSAYEILMIVFTVMGLLIAINRKKIIALSSFNVRAINSN